MHSSGSLIRTACEQIRFYLDQPDIDGGKYKNTYLCQFVMNGALQDVMSRVRMTQDNPVLIGFSVPIVANTPRYLMPPNVARIDRLAKYDTQGNLVLDAVPYSEFNVAGPGWYVEGNELVLRPVPQSGETFTLLYVPSGFTDPHMGTGTLADDQKTFTLADTVTTGILDKRPNAYLGSYLRILGADSWEDRIMRTQDGLDVTVGIPFAATAGDEIAYEVVPIVFEATLNAMVLSAAMKLGLAKRMTKGMSEDLKLAYRIAIKTAYDNLGNLMSRTGKRFESNTVDQYDGIAFLPG